MSDHRIVFALTLTYALAAAGLVCLIVARLFAPELHALGAGL